MSQPSSTRPSSGVADALSALHEALCALGGAARADLDPDTAENAFYGVGSSRSPHSIRDRGRRSPNSWSHFSGLCAQVGGFLEDRQT